MATQLQIRRGTTAQMNAFTGAEGELAVNTTTDTLHVHDGATAGGKALARADGSNIATYAGSFSTLAASGAATLNTLASSGATLTGGTINGVTVGATIPSTGAFTTIAASGAITGNVTGNLTGSVLTAAQTNITSVGTLSTLAVTGTADVTLDLNVGGAVKGNAGTRVVSVGTAGSVIGGLQLWSTTAGASYVQFGDEAGTSANHYRGYMSYSHANDSMALGTSGSTKVTIGSSGSVGIGGSPSAPLHVKSSTGNAIFLLEHASPTVGTGQVSRFVSSTSNVTDVIDSNGYYRIGSSTAPNTGAGFTERMRLNSAGSLLINSSVTADAGGNKLFINSGVNALPATSGTTQTGGALRLRGANNAVLDMGLNSVYTWIQATDKANLANGYSLSLNPNGGNVGIGLASPSYLIHADAATATDPSYFVASSGSNFVVAMGSQNSPGVAQEAFIGTISNHALKIKTNNTEGMRIESGNLLVGRTSSLGSGLLTVHSNNAHGLAIGYGTGTNEYRRLYHHSSGLYFESSTNQAYLNSAGVWTDASDITYKKEIEDIDYGIETVKKLKPRKYKMKSDDTEQIGFVAQELVEQVPEIVSEKDGILGVAYGQLTAVLTKAIQEQQATIEALTQRIQTLENN